MMEISGATKVCGLIGDPVDHSLSPLMQNYYAQSTGVDQVYVTFQVKKGNVATAINGAYNLNVKGMNVTIPHKQEVMETLVHIDEDASAIGAVNTLVRDAHGYRGYNTDAKGLFRGMQEEGIIIEGKTWVVLGAGGAAKAVAYLLAKKNAKKIYILNRTLEKAQELSDYVNGYKNVEIAVPLLLAQWNCLEEDIYSVVQTTSVGMHPKVKACPIEEQEFYSKVETAVDLIYTPKETQFLKRAKQEGACVMNGLSMLLYQGLEAYQLWNPEVLVTDDMIQEAKALLMKQLGEA